MYLCMALPCAAVPSFGPRGKAVLAFSAIDRVIDRPSAVAGADGIPFSPVFSPIPYSYLGGVVEHRLRVCAS